MTSAGRHFLQVPGPTNVPERVLRAMAAPTIDHRSPEFSRLLGDVLTGLREVFGTAGAVVVYPSSGTGAWEAALVNTLSPGDRVLMFETGHFATLWCAMARRLGLDVDFVPGDWRRGADPAVVERTLSADTAHAIRAVAVVHNETSTGVTSRIAEIRRAMDAARHPALLLVDTISSLGSIDYRHDAWGVDVTVACSQKGLMLPPGLGFNAIGPRALRASEKARLPRAYWRWEDMLEQHAAGFSPYTPSTNLLFGLREALAMLHAEGLEQVLARHARHAEGCRRAVTAWGLETQCADPREHSASLTAVRMPPGYDGDAVRVIARDAFDLSLGGGLGKLKGTVLRIGHLGDFNDLMLIGTLAGVEMALARAGVPARAGGVQAAVDYLKAPPDAAAAR